jgi:hypothetical protein
VLSVISVHSSRRSGHNLTAHQPHGFNAASRLSSRTLWPKVRRIETVGFVVPSHRLRATKTFDIATGSLISVKVLPGIMEPRPTVVKPKVKIAPIFLYFSGFGHKQTGTLQRGLKNSTRGNGNTGAKFVRQCCYKILSDQRRKNMPRLEGEKATGSKIAIGVIIALLAGGALWYFMGNRGGEDTTDSAVTTSSTPMATSEATPDASPSASASPEASPDASAEAAAGGAATGGTEGTAGNSTSGVTEGATPGAPGAMGTGTSGTAGGTSTTITNDPNAVTNAPAGSTPSAAGQRDAAPGAMTGPNSSTSAGGANTQTNTGPGGAMSGPPGSAAPGSSGTTGTGTTGTAGSTSGTGTNR